MVMVNYASQEVVAKVVYYGPGLSGKTTNLEYVNETVDQKLRGKMVSLATKGDRTLFFDLLPLEAGEIQGFKTKYQLYTVPGQVRYNATRRLVLTGADAIVFVADSQKERLQANKDSIENMKENMESLNMKLEEIPWIIQYNKRDLKNIYSIDDLERLLNHDGVPYFEACAVNGEGVMDTLRAISNILMDKIEDEGVEKLGKKGGSPKRSSAGGAGVTYDDILKSEDGYEEEFDAADIDFDDVDTMDIDDFEDLPVEEKAEFDTTGLEIVEDGESLPMIDIEPPVVESKPSKRQQPAKPKRPSPPPEPEPETTQEDSLHIKTSNPDYARHIKESQYLDQATKEIFDVMTKYGLTMDEIWYVQSKILNMYIDKRIRRHLERAQMILDQTGGQIFVLRSSDDFD